jgi:DNA-binding protein H-NS
MAVDIKNLNHNQLNELISKAQVRQTELRKEKVTKLREKINALIAAKYRNPGNEEQTWSGRGKRPRWFNEALKAGTKETDMLV